MPKTLVDQARYQFRNWKCDAKIHSSFADMRDLGKSFFATMVLPKYGIMNSDRSRTIPWHSLLYDKIEEAFVVEVLKHKANYPQTTDDEKYDTELKFHIMSHGMANFISERNHKPYTYYDNHYKLSHELGKIFVVGNGDLNLPFVDNFLSVRACKNNYSESKTPDYSRTADYHRKFKQIFKAVRVMDRDQLEAKYQELNQQVYSKLSAGGGAAFPNEQRAALLTRSANEDLKISDYVDIQKINKHIYSDVYHVANGFPTKNPS